jgi:hypothetical protein
VWVCACSFACFELGTRPALGDALQTGVADENAGFVAGTDLPGLFGSGPGTAIDLVNHSFAWLCCAAFRGVAGQSHYVL